MQFIPFPDLIRRYFSGEEFVIFDTETTGLNTFHDDIIEIAGARWQLGHPTEIFSELIKVNPNRIHKEAWDIHKIPLEEIERARPAPAVLTDFVNFCGNRTLIAHNAKYDFEIFNYNLIRNGFKPYGNDRVFCTFRHSQIQLLPGKLSALALRYKVPLESSQLHRALYDVKLILGILSQLMKLHEPKEMQYSLIL